MFRGHRSRGLVGYEGIAGRRRMDGGRPAGGSTLSTRIMRTAVAVLTVALLATASAWAQTQAGGLVKPGKDPGLHLIYTGDVIGYLEPCG